jgi:hypothetical protein
MKKLEFSVKLEELKCLATRPARLTGRLRISGIS